MKEDHDRSDDVRKIRKRSETAEVKSNKDMFDTMIATQRKNMKYYNIPSREE